MEALATVVEQAHPGRRERKKAALRAQIFETAKQLFIERGYEATTVDDIAAAADVAPATFFNHFQSKHAVLSEMTGEVFEHIETLLGRQLASNAPAPSRLMAFVDEAAREIEQSRSLAHNVLLELVRATARHGQVAPYLARAHAPIAQILAEGQRRQEIRSDLDSSFLAEMVVGAINATLINWLNDPAYPLERRVREAATFIIEAVLPGDAPVSLRRTP